MRQIITYCVAASLLILVANIGQTLAVEKDKTEAVVAKDQKTETVTSPTREVKESSQPVQPAVANPVKKKTAAPATPVPVKSALEVIENTRISVDYEKMPLRDVILDLREQLKINIMVYWPELKWAGYTPEDEITVSLHNVVAEQIVSSIVNYLSGGNSVMLGYQVDRNVLEIRLQENIQVRQEVKVYYVADLLSRPSRYDDSYFNDAGGNGGSNRGLSGRSNNRSGDRGGDSTSSNRSRSSSNLNRTIRQSVSR